MKTNAEMLKTVIDYGKDHGFVFETKYIYMDWDWMIDHRYYALLFSHPFAKAFWKEGTQYRIKNGVKTYRTSYYTNKSWKKNLQRAVISDNPILYYYNFVTERREG